MEPEPAPARIVPPLAAKAELVSSLSSDVSTKNAAITDLETKLTEAGEARSESRAHCHLCRGRGDASLWWVFAQRNPNALTDPLGSFVKGTKIYLPKIDTLRSSLGF